jgi:uncharacterized protein (DUF1810 family)
MELTTSDDQGAVLASSTEAMMGDRYKLDRFIAAQNSIYEQVLVELKQGRKTSHWMWFIFPQLSGLGLSPLAQKFAIGSLAEAQTYLQHPVLGARLVECTQLVVQVDSRSAEEIFGYPDELKFRSCMTLFAHAAAENDLFAAALQKYFSGDQDVHTVELLSRL